MMRDINTVNDIEADARRLLSGITPWPWSSREPEWYETIDDYPEDIEIVQGDDPNANPYTDIAEVKTRDWDDENDPEMWANAEFIAAAPRLAAGLLAKIDDIRAERDAALVTIRDLERVMWEVHAQRFAAEREGRPDLWYAGVEHSVRRMREVLEQQPKGATNP